MMMEKLLNKDSATWRSMYTPYLHFPMITDDVSHVPKLLEYELLLASVIQQDYQGMRTALRLL